MWIAFILGYAFAALLPPQTTQPTMRIDPRWVYVTDGLKWQTPPKGTTEGVKYCENALLAVLFPSGEYAGVGAILYRDNKTLHISMSRGDDVAIFKGHWRKLPNGSIEVDFKLAYSPLSEVRGKPRPPKEKRELWWPNGTAPGRIASKLKTPRVTLVPLENFTDLEFLSNYITVEGNPHASTPTTH